MCIICTDFKNNQNVNQGLRNLFEVKEQIGVEHAQEVLTALIHANNYLLPGKEINIYQAIVDFVTLNLTKKAR